MFVMASIARDFPEVVKAIHEAGHEIGSHGYSHKRVYDQTPGEFKHDIAIGKDVLEQLLGEEIRGYRAPEFSITLDSIWALEILAETGYHFDSSIYPIRNTRYGIEKWPDRPYEVRLPSGRSLIEFPITTYPLMDRNWPVGGGGYHRLLPGIVVRYLTSMISRERQVVYYYHPFEFNPFEMFLLPKRIPTKYLIHQQIGRFTAKWKLHTLLKYYGGRSCGDVIREGNIPQIDFKEIEKMIY